jgi:UDP-N-acetylglucosamine--N-acetylmuramyl-(pentapeptide) pyrophosphoryl-undecaprenol N-acetylglucosamine transferase
MHAVKNNYLSSKVRESLGGPLVLKRVLILAAGGGHTGYGYALAQALRTRATLSFLVPEGDLLSEKRLSRFGRVNSLLLPRGPKTPANEFAVGLVKAFVDSVGLNLQDFDVVVSTGSNFCIWPAFFAWMRGLPVVNIESSVRFVKPSKTARLLQPLSRITALQWEEQKWFLNGVVVGPLLHKPEVEPWKGGYVLVTGGTHGHRSLFDALTNTSLRDIVLQTGEIDPSPYRKRCPEWKVVAITRKFHELVAGADVVVTHLGSTIIEAVVYGKPIVLVPNPEWTRTGGLEDAKYLAKKVNAVLVPEIESERLLAAIKEARKRQVPTFTDGAEKLARIIVRLR